MQRALTEQADAVLRSLTLEEEPDHGALAAIRENLRAYVSRHFPTLDADDVVQGVLTRLLDGGFRAKEVENGWAYLLRSTRNASIDVIRAQERRPQVPLDAIGEQASTGGDDGDVGRLIEANASRAVVVEALQASLLAGDESLVRVITTWLDVADELGHAPSTRELAPLVGVSHTTVAKTLDRFRALLVSRR